MCTIHTPAIRSWHSLEALGEELSVSCAYLFIALRLGSQVLGSRPWGWSREEDKRDGPGPASADGVRGVLRVRPRASLPFPEGQHAAGRSDGAPVLGSGEGLLHS